MQSPCLHLCKNYNLGLRFHRPTATTRFFSPSLSFSLPISKMLMIQCQSKPNGRSRTQPGRAKLKGKKGNVWSVDSVDNEMAKASDEKEKERERTRQRRRRKGSRSDKVLVSGAMLMEVETVLQTQEPVIRPVWNTFASSVSGIWKGIGAVFSPITAQMEPIEIGGRNENLYDCYTLSRIEAVPSHSWGHASEIHRRIHWVTVNPYGEVLEYSGGINRSKEEFGAEGASMSLKEQDNRMNHALPRFESFDLAASDVVEEDVMGNEAGLVFFEDGSYSRGPVDISVGEVDDSKHSKLKHYLSPTFKFEQCLVKGCHKRLRIVHTIEFSDGGSHVQIMRVAVYEEEWVSPANIPHQSDLEFDLKLFSQRKRTRPSELTGSWKVFEVSATPVYGEELEPGESSGIPCVYLCMETLKKRSLPDSSVYFREEEMVDMQAATILWLPGGVTSYVDVNKDGILTIGVGWYSDEGINLVMERDYGTDGKLKEIRWKAEVKRRWSDPLPM